MARTRHLGIVGLGLVGRALAARAAASGMTASGYDVAPRALDAARAQNIATVGELRALVASSDALLVAVFDGEQLREIVEQALAHPVRPQLILHAVTAAPEISEKLAYRCEAAQVGFVEMPLSGSSSAIAAGEALALVGATDDAWALAQPLVERLAPEHVHVGGPGAGARAKLATNLVLGLNRTALAEGLLLAETLGIEGARFLDLLRRSPAYSRAVDTAGPRMVAGDFATVSRLSQHNKDLHLMLEAAARAGLDLPLARAHAALLGDGEAQGKGELDNVAVIAVLRDRSKRS
jgi:3-hydroxyisobutyrate dehydrogenase-like beta-hydroxyacid dehydrogenase